MRKAKLTLLSLIALGAMSLASCTGAQGEKGDKGDQGEQGIQGEPGEPGEPGEDGSLWYSGEGAPSSDLGKEGDMYLDTSTSDVYQKGSDGWTKITNIKGDKGEDGEDGKNGSNGSNGKTAWSNTILPSEGGYVIPSIGSGKIGDEITFTIYPEDGYILDSLALNDDTYLADDLKVEDNHYVLETTMVEHGFVVSASFKQSEQANVWNNGKFYSKAVFDLNGDLIESESSLDSTYPVFASGDGISAPLKISEEMDLTSEQAQKLADNLDYEFNVVGDNSTFDDIFKIFEADIDADLIKISIDENSILNLSKGYVLDANSFVVAGDGSTSKVNKTVTTALSSSETSTMFRFINKNGDKENFNADITGVDFIADCGENGSSFIRVDAYNDVKMNMSDVSFKTSSSSLIYGLQVIDNTGHVDLNLDNLVIDLGNMNDPNSLVKSYYPINLQNNEELTAHIKDSVFTGWGGIYIKDNSDTIYAENCTFNVINNVSDKVYSFSAIVIDGGELLNPSIGEVGISNYVEVSRSTFNLKNAEGYGGLNFASFQYGAKSNYLKFVDNIYNAEGNEIYDSQINFSANSGNVFEFVNEDETTLINDENLSGIKVTSTGEEESGKVYKIESPFEVAKVTWWCDENGYTEQVSTSEDPLTYINGETVETQLHDVDVTIKLSPLGGGNDGDYITLNLNIPVK